MLWRFADWASSGEARAFEKIMLIHWEYDDEEWDPYTLLGRVELEGDVCGRIHGEYLILDTWLLGLAQGLLEILRGRRVVFIDTFDEPDYIRICAVDGVITIRWIDQSLQLSDLTAACVSMAVQLRALADDLLKRPPPRCDQTISMLQLQAGRLVEKPG